MLFEYRAGRFWVIPLSTYYYPYIKYPLGGTTYWHAFPASCYPIGDYLGEKKATWLIRSLFYTIVLSDGFSSKAVTI